MVVYEGLMDAGGCHALQESSFSQFDSSTYQVFSRKFFFPFPFFRKVVVFLFFLKLSSNLSFSDSLLLFLANDCGALRGVAE